MTGNVKKNIVNKNIENENIPKYKPYNELKRLNLNKLKEGFYFIPLGGLMHIGMNLNAFLYVNAEGERQTIIVDAGTSVVNRLGCSAKLANVDALDPKTVTAIVCTHGHMDHIGAMGHIIKKFPKAKIYATEFTRHLVHRILSEHGFGNFDGYSIVKCNQPFHLGAFKITFLSITHSIPESNMIVISTDKGVIWHSGDWKFDANPVGGPRNDFSAMKRIAKQENVDLFLCDSTNAMQDEAYVVPTETKIRDNIKKLIEDLRKNNTNRLITISCFSSNVFRIRAMIEIFESMGIYVAIGGISMKKMLSISLTCGIIAPFKRPIIWDLKSDGNGFIDSKTGKKYNRDQVILICTGSQAEDRSVLMKMQTGIHPVKLQKNDVIVMSARVIPGNEHSIANLKCKLVDLGVKIIDHISYFESLHCSGHPSVRDMGEIVSYIHPKMIVPIHGSRLHIHSGANFFEKKFPDIGLIRPFNGVVIEVLKGGKSRMIGYVLTHVDFVDGKHLLADNSQVLRQRKILGSNGVIILSETRGNMQIQQIGVVESYQESKLFALIRRTINNNRSTDGNKKYKFKTNIAYHINREFGKLPIITVTKPKGKNRVGNNPHKKDMTA
jgi:ribonuclease J